MRFFVLSDLHLRAEVENYSTSNRIKKLCTQIRTVTSFDETILFIVLGDIANKGDELSFITADKARAFTQMVLQQQLAQSMILHFFLNSRLFL